MTKYEIITLCSQVVSVLFLALTVIYAARQLQMLHLTNKQVHDWNRRKAAQDMCVRYSEFNPKKTELLKELEYFTEGGAVTLNELEKKFINKPELRDAAHMMLNYFEYLCIGIKQGVYDENIVREFWSPIMNIVFHMLRQYILESRHHQQAIWLLVEEYSIKWEHEKKATSEREHIT